MQILNTECSGQFNKSPVDYFHALLRAQLLDTVVIHTQTYFASRPYISRINQSMSRYNTTNFSSLSNFNKTVSAFIYFFCKLNDYDQVMSTALYYAFVFLFYMFHVFYVFTTILSTMQHVRGLQVVCCSINLTIVVQQDFKIEGVRTGASKEFSKRGPNQRVPSRLQGKSHSRRLGTKSPPPEAKAKR